MQVESQVTKQSTCVTFRLNRTDLNSDKQSLVYTLAVVSLKLSELAVHQGKEGRKKRFFFPCA